MLLPRSHNMLKFSPERRYSWGLDSRILGFDAVIGWVVHDVLKDHRHAACSKYQKLLIPWHSIVSQKKWIFRISMASYFPSHRQSPFSVLSGRTVQWKYYLVVLDFRVTFISSLPEPHLSQYPARQQCVHCSLWHGSKYSGVNHCIYEKTIGMYNKLQQLVSEN